jgi:hypothetical protein
MERSSWLDYATSLHHNLRGIRPPSFEAIGLKQLQSISYGSGNHQHVMHYDTPELPAAAKQVPGGLKSAIRNTWGLVGI